MGPCLPANPVPSLRKAKKPQQGGKGVAGGGVQQVRKKIISLRLPPKDFLNVHLFCVPAELSVFREASPLPKLKASAPIWSQKCGFITGLPTDVKRKPSGRSWLWTPWVLRPTAWAHYSPTAPHIIPRPAHHLPVRGQMELPSTADTSVILNSLLTWFFFLKPISVCPQFHSFLEWNSA